MLSLVEESDLSGCGVWDFTWISSSIQAITSSGVSKNRVRDLYITLRCAGKSRAYAILRLQSCSFASMNY